MKNRLSILLFIFICLFATYIILNAYKTAKVVDNNTEKTPEPTATIFIDSEAQLKALKTPISSEIFDFNLVPQIKNISSLYSKDFTRKGNLVYPLGCQSPTFETETSGLTKEQYFLCRTSTEKLGLYESSDISFGNSLQAVSYEYETQKYLGSEIYNGAIQNKSCKKVAYKTLSGFACFEPESESETTSQTNGYITLPSFILHNSTNSTTYYITPTEIFRPTPDEINQYYNIALTEALQ